MGYQAGINDPAPPKRVELRSVSRLDFELITGFAYVPRNGPPIDVPPHPNEFANATDLASVPPLLWGLLPSYGRQLRAALVHDRLCDLVNAEKKRDEAYRQRRRADDVFREAMRDVIESDKDRPEELAKRVGWFRSWLFWGGVCYGRYWKFRKLLAILLTAQVLVGVFAVGFAARVPPLGWVRDHWLPSGLRPSGKLLLIYLAVLLLSVAWGRDRNLPIIGLLAGPVVVPVLLVTFVAQFLLGLPDWLIHQVNHDQPPGNFGPTVSKSPASSIAKTP